MSNNLRIEIVFPQLAQGNTSSDLTEIKGLLRKVLHKEDDIMSFVTDMDAKITAETDAITAVELVQTSLLQQIKDLIAQGGTPAELQALLDKMDANKAKLAALAVQGTPAQG